MSRNDLYVEASDKSRLYPERVEISAHLGKIKVGASAHNLA